MMTKCRAYLLKGRRWAEQSSDALFKFVGIFIEEINRASFGSVYKSRKYAMIHTRFTVLFYIMKCAFIEQNNYQKYLRARIGYEK